jgi:ribose 5-phosphate isomerase B
VRIAFGTDEVTPLTDAMQAQLSAAGHQVRVVAAGEVWPEVGRAVGAAVAGGVADRGVVCCWTGTGVSIAANKVAGVRAALCTDAETARGARRWNDANVLAVGLRLTSTEVAGELLDAFLGTDVDPGEMATIVAVDGMDPVATAPADGGDGSGERAGGHLD